MCSGGPAAFAVGWPLCLGCDACVTRGRNSRTTGIPCSWPPMWLRAESVMTHAAPAPPPPPSLLWLPPPPSEAWVYLSYHASTQSFAKLLSVCAFPPTHLRRERRASVHELWFRFDPSGSLYDGWLTCAPTHSSKCARNARHEGRPFFLRPPSSPPPAPPHTRSSIQGSRRPEGGRARS